MEPAAKRREHVLGAAPVGGVADTAMEPAVGRREHAEVYGLACDKDQAPQWSPPLNGGRTAHAGMNSGTVLLAAMEPAANRREH
jgi:hypothetical protein